MSKKNILDDTQAAIYLGITKELLYAYVRNAPKTNLGHDKKLISIIRNGKNLFEQKELDTFNDYLKEPWSIEGGKRPTIPKYIQEYLKTEIGGKCPITGKGYPLDNAHIEDYQISRSHHHHNIIRIAKDEHTKFDNGIISKDILAKTKFNLIENIKQNLKLENGNYKASIYSPKPHPFFIGRDKELLELVKTMETDRLIVIQGVGGVGKTQLLLNALENVTYHNPVLYIDTEALNTIKDIISLLSSEIEKINDTSLNSSLIDYLSSIQITIVLDSLENLLISQRDETEDFIELLMTRTNSVQLIITSQIDLSIFDSEKSLINLKGLSNLSSKNVISHIVDNKIDVNKKQIAWILWFCVGHPLSLKLTASLINFFKSSDKAIEHLDKSDSLKQPLRRKYNKSNSLMICFNTVYSNLNEEQKKILHLIKFYPAGMKKLWLKSLIESTRFDIDLASLHQFFFVDLVVDSLNLERVIVRNPIRKYIYDCAIEESQLEHILLEKDTLQRISIEALLIDHNYIETSIKGSAEYGILRMETELTNIMEAFHKCKIRLEEKTEKLFKKYEKDYLLITGSIASALGKFFFVRGFFEQAISIAKVGISVSVKQKMFESAATQYMYLSQIQSKQYDYLGFEKTVNDLNDLAESSGDEYVIICSNWLKGRFLSNQGKFDKAMNHFNKVVRMMESRKQKNLIDKKSIPKELRDSINIQETGNVGLVYSEIGFIYLQSKDYKKALEFYEKGLEIQIKLKDEVNTFSSYFQVAICYVKLNEEQKAIDHYFKCVQGFQDHNNFEYLANTLAELGRLSETHPQVAQNKLLTKQIFENALNNLTYRLYNFIERKKIANPDDGFTIEDIPHELVGQMILLTMLTGLSEYKIALTNWAILTNEKIDYDNKLGIDYYSAILNLAHSIGLSDQWNVNSQEEKKLPLKTIYQSCLIINGGPDLKSKTRIFYWLAQWMRSTNIDKSATAQKLWDKAWNSFD